MIIPLMSIQLYWVHPSLPLFFICSLMVKHWLSLSTIYLFICSTLYAYKVVSKLLTHTSVKNKYTNSSTVFLHSSYLLL